MKITNEVLEGYLNCKTKGHLKLAGESDSRSDYEAMTKATRQCSRDEALAQLVSRFGDGDACRGVPISATTLKQGAQLLADATLDEDGLSIRLDALKRVAGTSKLGQHHYLPILHSHEDKVGQPRKLLLAVFGLALDGVQGLRPTTALVARGPTGRLSKVNLSAKLYRQAEQVLDELKRLQKGGEPPNLALNRHCQQCEFRNRCRKKAEQADDISLLGGVGEKELRKLNRKGIFTLTQLSCTFRPRMQAKRVKRTSYNYQPALQALAIREKKVHVYGTPDIPRKPVQVFLDAEGIEGEGFVYLLGVLLVEGDRQEMHSFWADGQDQEVQVFGAMLDLLDGCENLALFHYGGYERKLLKRMRKVVKRKKLVDRLLANAVNILSAIHGCVYFPVFSNGLKEVGRYLGCAWTADNASGLQSMVWRARWDQAREPVWKDRLLTYNAEDCAALRKVTEFIHNVAEMARHRGEDGEVAPGGPAVAWADEVIISTIRQERGGPRFAFQEFDHINHCSFFDYQREKVYLRTSKAVKRACLLYRKRRKPTKPPANREIEIGAKKCPFCEGTQITRIDCNKRTRRAYDLKFTPGGVRRQVIRCTAYRYRCANCKKTFLPKRYKRRDKHLHGLKSWAMYQHVVHRISLQNLERMFEDCFGLRVNLMELLLIKSLMARRYRATLNQSLARIVGGQLLHADETHANLQQGKGYVWVLANMVDVVYMYRPNREAGFLKDLLKDFKGVLVSDFFSGYDSMPCEQQKCLIHLIRDMNADLKRNPYDGEFKALAAAFAKLLRSIIDTIDQYGLKRRHLHKHKPEVARFFRGLTGEVYRSELAESYRQRLIKNEGKLFTFLDHDEVPWNNNNAEHAIRAFADYRKISDGKMKEQGLSDYLVLLSIYQTCKYRGVSFLKFLLSQEKDVEAYCRQGRKRKQHPRLEVYPKCFFRKHCKKDEPQGTKDET